MDFYDAAENAMNEIESEEEMAAEHMENEGIELEAQGKYEIEKVFDYLANEQCCSNKCCSTWEEDDLIKHAQDMGKLSKTEKKLMLLTILRNGVMASESTRYSEHRQRLRFTFRYEPFGKMCASAFRLLFDIRIDALKGLIAHLKSHDLSIVPPVHGNNGKKIDNKSNSLASIGVTEKVIEFMLALGEAQGEFSPGRHIKNGNTKEDKDPNVLWLPGCFTISAILRMYNQRHPDLHISRTAFCTLLKNEPKLQHIKIRSPRSDMCDFCEIQKRKITGIKPYDESRAEKLIAELMAHQKAYQGERDVYNTERKQGKMDRKKFRQGKLKADKCVEHISIDYGQSIGVPYTTDQLGGTFFLHMRNFHLFGICSVLENSQVCYTYDEREAGKGSNEVISFLHDFLSTREIQTPNIRIHADNCKGQNKNKYVIWYLLWLVATGRAKRI